MRHVDFLLRIGSVKEFHLRFPVVSDCKGRKKSANNDYVTLLPMSVSWSKMSVSWRICCLNHQTKVLLSAKKIMYLCAPKQNYERN